MPSELEALLSFAFPCRDAIIDLSAIFSGFRASGAVAIPASLAADTFLLSHSFI